MDAVLDMVEFEMDIPDQVPMMEEEEQEMLLDVQFATNLQEDEEPQYDELIDEILDDDEADEDDADDIDSAEDEPSSDDDFENQDELFEFYGDLGFDENELELDDDIDADSDYIAQLMKSEELGDFDNLLVVDELGIQHRVPAHRVIGAHQFQRTTQVPRPERKNLQSNKQDLEGLSRKQVKKLKMKEKKANRREIREAKGVKFSFDEVLKLNREIQSFVRDSVDDCYAFPPMTRKRRYTLHRLSTFYGLNSFSEGSGQSRFTICSKTPQTMLPPETMIQEFLIQFQLEYQANQFGSESHFLKNSGPSSAPTKCFQPPKSKKKKNPTYNEEFFSKKHQAPPELFSRGGRQEASFEKTPTRNSNRQSGRGQKTQPQKGGERGRGAGGRGGGERGRGEKRGGKGGRGGISRASNSEPNLFSRGRNPIGSSPQTKTTTTPTTSTTSTPTTQRLGSENAGYQMLLSMGWQGGGLGVGETGAQAPVPVRVKLDRRGLGC